ncbi:MAG: SufE family protein [Bacteroidota bacterium]|jgi:cysteine desulfuration protein SufE|nr:SufE family protein [Bacteroidota bacterium]
MIESAAIAEREAAIVEAFALLDTWEEKYEYIIDLGKQLPPLEEKYKVADNIIKGCQSTVWLVASFSDGKVYFKADSDAVIVKGLVSLLIQVLSGLSPDEILQAQLGFLQEIGMMSHLAQTRSNGLRAMIQQMKHYALAFQSIQS